MKKLLTHILVAVIEALAVWSLRWRLRHHPSMRDIVDVGDVGDFGGFGDYSEAA